MAQGGSRFETIGDIVYSGVMGSVSVILVVSLPLPLLSLRCADHLSILQAFSIQSFIKGNPGPDNLHIPAIAAVGVAFITKLGLFIYCYSIRSKNSQVRVLWEDQ